MSHSELKVWVIDFREVDYEIWLDWLVAGSNPDYNALDRFYDMYFTGNFQGLAVVHEEDPLGLLVAATANPGDIVWFDCPAGPAQTQVAGLLLNEYCHRTGLEAFALRLVMQECPEETGTLFRSFF